MAEDLRFLLIALRILTAQNFTHERAHKQNDGFFCRAYLAREPNNFCRKQKPGPIIFSLDLK